MKGNILKIDSIPKHNKWCDKEILIVHACFQTLVDCIEKERLFDDRAIYLKGNADYPEGSKISKELNELKILYKWWKNIGSKMNNVDILSNDTTEKLIKLINLKHNLWV